MNPMFMGLIMGGLGIIFCLYLVKYVFKNDEGTPKVKEIAEAIREGALAFLHREYSILVVFVAVVAIALGVIPDLGGWVSLSFVFGALCSMAAGYLGMNMAIRSNSRTTTAAQHSLNQGLRVSFRAGSVMGIMVVSIGMLGITVLYFAFEHLFDAADPLNRHFIMVLSAYGFGASTVALFARVAGGIYTKGADTGADLVGKVEKGIPEDDPRNAAVIADCVGDNVGDVAGMGADLFESYVESIIAAMALFGVATGAGLLKAGADPHTAFWVPMMVAVGGLAASIVGVFLVRVGQKSDMGELLNALRRGTVGASVLTAGFAFLAIWLLDVDIKVAWAVIAGLIAGVLIGESTNYFTSYAFKPTRNIAKSTETGPATTVISGFANGLLSTLPPVVLVAAALMISYWVADLYGIALAGVGMLSTLGVTLATDAYGPIADNAGGISQMADLPHEVRDRTDALDSLGNTTAATGKGFAIGSAALTAAALVFSYTQFVGIDVSKMTLLEIPNVTGLLVGIMVPAVFCALTMSAVGKTASLIVAEVRRQFKEITGLWEGTARPDYGKTVDICTKGALQQMILPAVLALASPLIVGFSLGKEALAAFLLGAIGSGFVLAITLANAGGAWDNAKKYIETGAHGGKGSDSHKAGVVGDTVGDPMKDTSGPSLNVLIKLMAVVSLVLAPLFEHASGVL